VTMTPARTILTALLLVLALLTSLPSSATPSKICQTRVDLKIAARDIAWISCDSGVRGLEAIGVLFDVSGRDDDPTAPALEIAGAVTIRLIANTRLHYSAVHFPSNLQPNKNYVLKIVSAGISKVVPPGLSPGAEGWASIYVPFTTKATTVLTNSKDPVEMGSGFVLTSDIGLAACSQQKPTVQEILPLLKPKPHEAVLQRSSLSLPDETDTPTGSCQLPVNDPETGKPQFNPPRIGQAFLTLRSDRFYQAKAQLNVKGVYDVFGQEISIPKDKQKIALKDLPKGKDDASYYLQFSDQAGPGAKPSWALDAKAVPVFGSEFAGFSPTLNLLANVGYGNVQSPNTITLGGGLTQFFPTGHSTLQAVRFSPTFNFETDRTFDQERNLIFSPDLRIYLSFLNNKRDLRSRRAYINAIGDKSQAEISKVDPDDPTFKKYWGFFTQLWIGVETGGSVISPTVQTPDKTTSVLVPSYGIVRLHPKLQTNFELWRFTLDFNVTSRYIGETEYVGRVISTTNPITGAKKSVAILDSVQGWRGYGEISLSFALDQSSHVNLTTTYKRGSAPPSFNKVDVVQSGITLKY
jgi:hypothetical protein